jgi:hypothetical protein
MRAPRFSIAALLVVVAVCGVLFAALSSPSDLWAKGLFTLALGALVVAVINVLFSGGCSRAFWAGFLIAGGTYFVVSTTPGLRDHLVPQLFTELVLDQIYRDIVARSHSVRAIGSNFGMASRIANLRDGLPALQQTSHSLFTLLFAALGGAYARLRYTAHQGRNAPA